MPENGICCVWIDIQGEYFRGVSSENFYKILIVFVGFIAGVGWGLNIRNVNGYEFVAFCPERIRYCRNKLKEIGMSKVSVSIF